MVEPAQFPYTLITDPRGTVLIRPLVSIHLTYTKQTLAAEALLDTGADVSVLPYHQGLLLGLNWESAAPTDSLSGNLSQIETRAVILDAVVSPFPPVRLAFIWVKSDIPHLILGQLNFFQKFNVCFFGSDRLFEIHPRLQHSPT